MGPGAVGCNTCFGSDASVVWENRRRFEFIERLVDESHYVVSIIACPDCAQRFLSVFTEKVDWVNGEDPTENSIFPLSRDEAASVVAKGDALNLEGLDFLGESRRHLRSSWPSSGPRQLWWATGRLQIGSYD
jgi:uncharacterized protein YbaR (Trm112 family)